LGKSPASPIRRAPLDWLRARRYYTLIFAVWLLGLLAFTVTAPEERVVVVHWANGHMMDYENLFPTFVIAFNQSDSETATGKAIEVHVFKANSGEITGELQARITHNAALDAGKPDPTIVTPAADHWVNDVDQLLGLPVLDTEDVEVIASTYVGIVTSREMAQCLGWPQKEIGFADIVSLATDPQGWSHHPCARPEWGEEALVAFTYPARSSTARSVLYTLFSIASGKPIAELKLEDVSRPDVAEYVKRFQSAIDCYVPDTLDLNLKILTNPPCAHFYFIAEDNLVKLYQGKIEVPPGDTSIATHLERDMVMIYPKEGAIIHNHSAMVVHADFVSADQMDAAIKWIAFLKGDRQQRALMQDGFRTTTAAICIAPLGSPFSQCASSPNGVIHPDQISPEVGAAILKVWD
jgi:Ca-activated chloride channel family protein